jgi:hypothetical protein
MPGPWLLTNVVVTGLAFALAVGISREATRPRPLVTSPASLALTPVKTALGDAGAQPKSPAPLAAFEPVAARNLFSPARSEAARVVPATAARAKPILHGVVVFGDQSRAYLEDPAEKRVFGYAVGDPVAGGRLERITDDRAVIRLAEGVLEVLLHDPTKPRPGPARAPTTKAAPPAAAAPTASATTATSRGAQ